MSATFTRVPQMFWVPSRNFHFFDGINRFWKKILCWLEKCQWNGVINCVHPFYNTMSCPWSILSFARRVMYMTTWLYYDSMIAIEFHSTNPQEGVSLSCFGQIHSLDPLHSHFHSMRHEIVCHFGQLGSIIAQKSVESTRNDWAQCTRSKTSKLKC